MNKDKLIRTLTAWLPVDPQRQGECHRCGACCKLPTPCAFLRYDADGKNSRCAIYAIRPPNCRKYPRTASEQLTAAVCGYTFGDAKPPAPEQPGANTPPK